MYIFYSNHIRARVHLTQCIREGHRVYVIWYYTGAPLMVKLFYFFFFSCFPHWEHVGPWRALYKKTRSSHSEMIDFELEELRGHFFRTPWPTRARTHTLKERQGKAVIFIYIRSNNNKKGNMNRWGNKSARDKKEAEMLFFILRFFVDIYINMQFSVAEIANAAFYLEYLKKKSKLTIY